MNEYQKSALIGYYRNGMDNIMIASIFDITVQDVESIISNYLRNKK